MGLAPCDTPCAARAGRGPARGRESSQSPGHGPWLGPVPSLRLHGLHRIATAAGVSGDRTRELKVCATNPTFAAVLGNTRPARRRRCLDGAIPRRGGDLTRDRTESANLSAGGRRAWSTGASPTSDSLRGGGCGANKSCDVMPSSAFSIHGRSLLKTEKAFGSSS